jgi:hypothetical protein
MKGTVAFVQQANGGLHLFRAGIQLTGNLMFYYVALHRGSLGRVLSNGQARGDVAGQGVCPGDTLDTSQAAAARPVGAARRRV